MAMHNPKGRANYEPNSWGDGGPRECPEKGFISYPQEVSGEKQRVRSESFADHYSQARQFYISQMPIEQQHIADALAFELSKVKTLRIREKIVSHLLNIDQELASKVAEMLAIEELPQPAEAALPTRYDLPPSDKLSILKNGPQSFKGRKIGVLMTEGGDAAVLKYLESTLQEEGAIYEVVAPHAGELKDSDGAMIQIDEKIDGGPSVLFDAIVILPGAETVNMLMTNYAAVRFVSDAFNHNKFIGYVDAAQPLLNKANIEDMLDNGCHRLNDEASVQAFITKCRDLRYWERG
jgi:catalase